MTKSATTGKTGELQAATLPNSPLAHVERGVESGRNYKVHPKSLTLAGKFDPPHRGLRMNRISPSAKFSPPDNKGIAIG